MLTIGKDEEVLDEIDPAAVIIAFQAASQETSGPGQFQLALRRAGEAKYEKRNICQSRQEKWNLDWRSADPGFLLFPGEHACTKRQLDSGNNQR